MKEGKTRKLDELVVEVLKNMGVYRQYREHQVLAVWPEVAGKVIASHTVRLDVSDGKLFVAFDSAVIRNEVLLVREGLLQALNDRMGERLVREIIIR